MFFSQNKGLSKNAESKDSSQESLISQKFSPQSAIPENLGIYNPVYQNTNGIAAVAGYQQPPFSSPFVAPPTPFLQPVNGHQKQKLRPNFTNTQINNVKIPTQIAREIRSEKWRITGSVFLGAVFFTFSLVFILIYFLAPIVDGMQLKIPVQYIPHPAAMFVLLVVGLVIFSVGWIDFSHLKIGVRNYRADILMGVESIPFFLIKNYKALLSRPIYLNWLSFNVYAWGGIVVGIFYAIKSATHGQTPMNTEIIIMFCILVVTLIIQIGTLINVRSRKGRICAYYGYEIIPADQCREICKRANRICLITFFIFLAIVLFVIFIPYLLLRKKSQKSILPRF